MTIDEAISHALEVAEEQSRLYSLCPCPCDGTDNCMSLKNGKDMGCTKLAADHRQLAAWLTDYKELEAKHWDECRQIAHYDNDVKHLCLIIQDRISYVTDYGKAILEGKYSDSYEYNKGYCTALNDILDMIHEITETEEG